MSMAISLDDLAGGAGLWPMTRPEKMEPALAKNEAGEPLDYESGGPGKARTWNQTVMSPRLFGRLRLRCEAIL
jgi:hypothetical protein